MPEPAGRFAFRVEGSFWNAYWAAPDTMQGAVLLASMHVAMRDDPQCRAAFIKLVQDGTAHVLRAVHPGLELSCGPPRPPPRQRRRKR